MEAPNPYESPKADARTPYADVQPSHVGDDKQPAASPVSRWALVGASCGGIAPVLSVAIAFFSGRPNDKGTDALIAMIWMVALFILLVPIGALIGAIVGFVASRPRRLNLPGRPSNATIRLTSDGFSIIERDGTLHQVVWASVKEVFAFKRDMGTFDTIRLGFRISDDGTYWEIDEDDTGFCELEAELEPRFDIVDKNWWNKVAFPAFGTNRTTLWGEPGTEPQNQA